MLNIWKPYPKYKPKEKGWYMCSIKYGKDQDKAYVMDLWWDPIKEAWKDNRRLHVFKVYEVYGYGSNILDQPTKKRLYQDNLCERTTVIAFKKLPKIYKKKEGRSKNEKTD